jgi:hypothetical protein
MNRLLHTTVIYPILLLTMGGAVDAAAETTISATYSYSEGDNRYGGNGWDSVRNANGASLSIRHIFGQWYVDAEIERAKLKSRHRMDWRPGPLWPMSSKSIDYDPRLDAFRVRLGRVFAVSERIDFKADVGLVRETWTVDGASISTASPPSFEVIPRFTGDIDTFSAATMFDIDLWNGSVVSLGALYQHESYFNTGIARWHGGLREPPKSKALIEGSVKLHQNVHGPIGVFVEIRHSSQRDYARIGLDWRF